jgi:serine/threonine protein kinase
MQNLTGQSIGRYHILEKLGEGGMAVVYKAFDTHLERDVAIKVIRSDDFSTAMLQHVLERFRREAKILAKLTHPNIVSIIDFGDHEGSLYLVMPYLRGGTLKEHLGIAIPWQDAVRILLPIASALAYAHGLDVVHRDIKPANILITASGEPMLTDFGIARILDLNAGHTLTIPGAGIGTPEYMAPEQWIGKSNSASDQYSLGVVFYEMITNRKPYTADTPAAILLKQANDPLPRPGEFVQNLPKSVEHFLFKALAKNPEDRYQSMSEMTNALVRLERENLAIEKYVSKRRRASNSGDIVDLAEPKLPNPGSTESKEDSPLPAKKKHRIWPFLAGFGGLIALVVLIIGISGGFKPQNTPTAAPLIIPIVEDATPVSKPFPPETATSPTEIISSPTYSTEVPTAISATPTEKQVLVNNVTVVFGVPKVLTIYPGDLTRVLTSECIYFINRGVTQITNISIPLSIYSDYSNFLSLLININTLEPNQTFTKCIEFTVSLPDSPTKFTISLGEPKTSKEQIVVLDSRSEVYNAIPYKDSVWFSLR